MSKVRWQIESDSISAQTVSPVWDGAVEHSIFSQQIFFRARISEILFLGEDRATILSAPDCEEIQIWAEEKCGEDWNEIWRGTFTTYDLKLDENKCTARVVPEVLDGYTCVFKTWENEVVVIDGPKVKVKPFAGKYEAGAECCLDCVPTNPVGPLCAVPDGWCFQGNTSQEAACGDDPAPGDPYDEVWMSCFHRVTGIGTPTDPPPFGSGWELLSGSTWWRCPGDTDLVLPVFDEGRWFNDCFEFLAGSQECPLTVKSHFFGINADHDAPPDNIAYDYAVAYLQEMQLHQKSDIKRPFDTNPAQSFVWKMTLRRLLDDLRTMFYVSWVIDGSDLIVEHRSYFESAPTLDVSKRNIRLEYGKQEGQAPNEEFFFWSDKDATVGPNHIAAPIRYGACGSGKEEYRVNYFTNDVLYLFTVQNSEEAADSGFSLISTEEIDGERVIIEGNRPLGFPLLHENLHLWGRFFENGTMNGDPTVFESVKKTRSLEPFTVKICCDDEYTPQSGIITKIGDAQPERVTINYNAGANARNVKIEANL